jgi:hypothetical protein
MGLTILEMADQITPEIEEDIANCVEWFDGSPTMGTQEFLDKLCDVYGAHRNFETDEWEGYDLESYDNPAARAIMRKARQIRKEMTG